MAKKKDTRRSRRGKPIAAAKTKPVSEPGYIVDLLGASPTATRRTPSPSKAQRTAARGIVKRVLRAMPPVPGEKPLPRPAYVGTATVEKKKPSVAATNRKLLRNPLIAQVADVMRADDAPSRPEIGGELREIVNLLKRAESLIIVAKLALDGQDVEQDAEIAELLQRDVGGLLFKQIAHLAKLAGQCDGLPLDEDDEGRVQDAEEDDGLGDGS